MKQKHTDSGVVTLEACIVVPMFIVLMLCVNGLFVMFMGQQIIAHAAIQSAKSLSLDPYATDRVTASSQSSLMQMFEDLFTIGDWEFVSTAKWYEDEQADVEDVVQERFLAFLTAGEKESSELDELLETLGVEGGAAGISFEGSNVDGDTLTLKISYVQNFVLNAGDLTSFERTITLQIKLFRYKN